ncbi:M23 family metallopeptidase [Actibacterium sp. 188UL27-1]|uniref:M23 family metallopeptidase n=1 Tax=Actibacterium sp. 188UL27-1 TaxID=2786961 RepID=UPI001958F1B0|nr:M23 family metallopeptidase [Actibacterium sp. 188UL27-1]MBM7066084.1 M23 family metallopeptidase [Actibacterium sp. 188UL27-1]
MDYRCGTLANDGHSGTDFAVPTIAEMKRGVPVVAVAPGTVTAVRDGMADTPTTTGNAAEVAGLECGNGVVIRHENGWESQYCHLRQKSIRVSTGDKIQIGDPLGHIGLSGEASFPHVHLSLRRDGRDIDPFSPQQGTACGSATEHLWSELPEYQPSGLLKLGIADRVPELIEVEGGLSSAPTIATDTPALVIWSYTFATKADDIVQTRIIGPNGVVGEHDQKLERGHAFYLDAFGKRTPPDNWPPGIYTGTVKHIRHGNVMSEKSVSIELR